MTLSLNSLKNLGLKNTRTRRFLIDTFRRTNKPLAASEIYENLTADKTTIYRELKTLVDSNLLKEVYFGDGIIRYERSDMNHHHHLVCLNCQFVQDISFNEDLLRQVVNSTTSRNFNVIKHSLEFFGYCHQCSKELNDKRTN